jgi:hypothetical protein
MIRLLTILTATALLAAACGSDDADPEPTPLQTQAISTLIDAELSADEQRCLLDGLIETGIEPASVIEGTLGGDDDAQLLAVAVECVEDLTDIRGFVQSFIEGAALEGTDLTETQARCVIESIDDVDPAVLIARCLDTENESPPTSADDDRLVELLSTACRNGNNQACDELYELAPQGSEPFELARTCAGRLPDSIGLRCYLDLDA